MSNQANGDSEKMSFVPVTPESHFPIQNLPYGVFSTPDNVSTHDTIVGVGVCYVNANGVGLVVAKTNDISRFALIVWNLMRVMSYNYQVIESYDIVRLYNVTFLSCAC